LLFFGSGLGVGAWALGAATGVDDLEALTFANFICNEQGLDPISFGSTIGAAMELYELGVLGKEQTGGLELRFGSAEALTKSAELVGKAEGFGKELGLGSARLCAKYVGRSCRRQSRARNSQRTTRAGSRESGSPTPPPTAAPVTLRSYTVSSEILGIPHKTDPLVTDGKAGLVKAFQDATAAVDSTGLCIFTTFAWTLNDIAPQINAAIEGGWTADKMLEAGERIWNLERQFNNQRASPPPTTACPSGWSRRAPRPARPKGSSTASTRCCRNTTSCAAGPRTACPPTRR
jgi:aldehyde:ferredoxin oxidoreductase